ncbi:MAG: PEP-CTERM sorting domain-containing protein [Planctomycetes bacterium]|nr:PEP-CTERM sorting domain-containing protein [Planctomycetota bacterium]
MTPVVLNGGTFSVGNLVNAPLLQFNSGTFRLTDENLTIDEDGMFGNRILLGPNQCLDVTNGTTVAAGASLEMQGGVFAGGYITNNGLITGDGEICAAVTNAQAGEIRVSTGDNLALTDYGINNGKISLLGGSMEFTGQSFTNPTGNILGRGALIAHGGFINQGDIALSNGVTDVYGDLASNAGGRVIISGRADVTFWDDVNNQGTMFNVSADSSVTFFGGFSGTGISGAGTVYFEADVTPGLSPAAVSFEGNITFGPASRLEIELAGTAPGTEYDAIDVAGSLTTDGTLDVIAIEGFTPQAGNTFDLLDFNIATLTGAFDIVNLPALGPGLMWYIDSLYTSGEIVSVFPGDLDLDGDVDIFDWAIFQPNYGTTSGATYTSGDLDDDGNVDIFDWAIFQPNYGKTCGTGGEPIPEPASLALLGLGAAALLRRRR